MSRWKTTNNWLKMELENALVDEWFDAILSNNNKFEYFVSSNKYLTIRTIKKYPMLYWSWKDVSRHPNITMNNIMQNGELKWDFDDVLQNPNFTFDIVLRFPDKNWNWEILSKHPMTTMDVIQNNPQLNWNYIHMLQNPNLTQNVATVCLNKIAEMNAKTPTHSVSVMRARYCNIMISQFSIQQRLTKLLLFSIHEYHTTNPRDVSTSIEHILFDNYLLSHIAKY